MASISEGNRLYLYNLIKEQVGLGKQMSLLQFEELLASDDIAPADLECADSLELAEALDDFLKLTVFKKGRIFATGLANERYDGILKRLESRSPKDITGKASQGKQKPWKRKKSTKDPTPAKPRKKQLVLEEVEKVAEASVEGPAKETQKTAVEKIALAEEVEKTVQAVEASVEEADVEETPAEASSDEETEIQAPVPELSESLAAEDQEDLQKLPEEEHKPSIQLTIIHNPTGQEAVEKNAPISLANPELVRPPLPQTPAQTPTHASLEDLPKSISSDVFCGTPQLRYLRQLLPYDVDPLQVLEEDWQLARSVGDYLGGRSKFSFSLRYVHENGSPVSITLKRASRHSNSKPWLLAYIDGNDGTGDVYVSVGTNTLALAHQYAWQALRGAKTTESEISPERAFAQFAELGSWGTLLGSLAMMAAPERWHLPGERAENEQRFGILREYICLTFYCAQKDGRVSQTHDGNFAAFDTGLLTPFSERIYACFERPRSADSLRFAGFSVAGSSDLGLRLVCQFDSLPQPPRYIKQLSDVIPEPGRMTILDVDSLLSLQLGRFPREFVKEQLSTNFRAAGLYEELASKASRGSLDSQGLAELGRAIKADPGLYRRMSHALEAAVELALRHAETSYRSAAPVYDPEEDRVKLALPLSLVDGTHIDCACVLSLQPSGAYLGSALISLDTAYVCARLICREPPSWLRPEHIFGD